VKGDLLADPLNIFSRWKYHFSHLLNSPGISDVRQIEIHGADPVVLDHGHFEVKIDIK
jgi:hypothetical protein